MKQHKMVCRELEKWFPLSNPHIVGLYITGLLGLGWCSRGK